MFKEVALSFVKNPKPFFKKTERQLLRHIYRKYLNNKIFYQPLNTPGKPNPLVKKLERSLNLRSCLLYFYCNPLLKQPFDILTIKGLYENLAELEAGIIIKITDTDIITKYRIRESALPDFLLFGGQKQESVQFDLKLLYQGILENEKHSQSKSGVLWQELLKFLTILRITLRLPFVYLFRILKFRKSVVQRFRHIESIQSLWKNITVLSFQLNFLVFRKGMAEIFRGKTEIVDLSILVMLIGDDFIDQIAQRTGSENVISLIHQKADAFEIKIDADYILKSDDLVLLYKTLNIEKEKVSEKYNMTFDQLFVILLEIFNEINTRLYKIDLQERKGTSEAISSFLNYCLSTYMDDLLFSTFDKKHKYSLSDTSWYYFKKNNCVMMYGLWLRAGILGLDYEKFLPQIKEWGHLVENIQLYDDLKDMSADWNFQPNYPLTLSYGYFREEYLWFVENMSKFKGCSTAAEVVNLSIAMPKTVSHTMLMSRYMGETDLTWFTKFATNYCWNQNWNSAFLPLNGLKKTSPYNLPLQQSENQKAKNTISPEINLVFSLMAKTAALFSEFDNKDFYFDYLLMLCLHERNFSRSFYIRTPIIDSYNLVFRFQFMSSGYKTRLLNRYMKKKSKAVNLAIDQENSVSHLLPDDLIEYICHNWIGIGNNKEITELTDTVALIEIRP